MVWFEVSKQGFGTPVAATETKGGCPQNSQPLFFISALSIVQASHIFSSHSQKDKPHRAYPPLGHRCRRARRKGCSCSPLFPPPPLHLSHPSFPLPPPPPYEQQLPP
eukprot:Sspe_Gene.106459::Locus_84521_Transcript_1_1_Confidence_1.000_Length_496::g.106459::m.106459